MSRLCKVLASVLLVLCSVRVAWGEDLVRVATYNIRFLNTGVAGVDEAGDRLEKLREVIELLDADVVGLQEIDDRAALELVFSGQDWLIIIDDDSGENQDLALAVRKPLEVLGCGDDLDADDEHFLFEDAAASVPRPA